MRGIRGICGIRGILVESQECLGILCFFFLSAFPESQNPRILESRNPRNPNFNSATFFLEIPWNPVEPAFFYPGIRVESATFFWYPRAYVRFYP